MLVIDHDSTEGEMIFDSTDGWDITIASLWQLLESYADYDLKETESGGIAASIPIVLEHFPSLLEILTAHPGEIEFTQKGEHIWVWIRNLLSKKDIYRKEESKDKLNEKLRLSGWNMGSRSLSEFQMTNLIQTSRRDEAAIFSVPGAGKTVEALAYSVVVGGPNVMFLVIAPRNAFIAWEQELEATLSITKNQIIRASGNDDEIRGKLIIPSTPYRAVLVNYNRLWYRYRAFTDYVLKMTEKGHTIVTIMDESHHFKGGKAFTSAVKRVTPFADHRILLSGTPMPKGPEDLVHQFKALIPYKSGDINDTNVQEFTQKRFVRTTKNDLNLKKVNIKFHEFEMDKIQRQMYELLTDIYSAEFAAKGNRKATADISRLQRVIIYLVMHTSNPLLINELLAGVLTKVNPKLSQRFISLKKELTDYGPKVRFACERARELANENKKVLIWTSFVDNVEFIADELQDLGAVFIRGDVPTIGSDESSFIYNAQHESDEEQESTREERIHKFKTDPECMVLVANPAAAGEGISLHDVCHHAIYVDRTFHATEFMQSMDRIHRYGKDGNHDIICQKYETYIDILQCKSSVDSTVHRNLARKMEAMYKWLNDSSLSPQLGMLDPFISEEEMNDLINVRE